VGCDQILDIKNHQITIKINKIKQGFEPMTKIEIGKWFVDCKLDLVGGRMSGLMIKWVVEGKT
jgi:hypothetical protein